MKQNTWSAQLSDRELTMVRGGFNLTPAGSPRDADDGVDTLDEEYTPSLGIAMPMPAASARGGDDGQRRLPASRY